MVSRLSTGVAGLDEVLDGGLPDHSINLISGPPGVGKTVLVQQVMFGAAAEGRPALYYSTVAEPYEKIIAHVQPFAYFQKGAVGRYIHFRSLGEALCSGGLDAALAQIKADATTIFPRFVVIDSFRAFRDFASSAMQMAKFLYDMAGTLSALDCIVFLLDESPLTDVMASPAAAVADGIINLNFSEIGRSDRRWIQVLKLRGSRFLSGSHFLSINGDGVTVYPRLGSIAIRGKPAGPSGICPTYHRPLDDALGGGLPRGSTVVITGSPGSGKTVFGLSFIVAGTAVGEPGVFLSMQETEGWLLQTADSLGLDLAQSCDRGRVSLLHVPPVDVEVDRLGHRLLAEVDRVGAKRAVLDAVTDLDTAAIPDDDYQGFLYSLGRLLQDRGVTTVFVATTASIHEPPTRYPIYVSRAADGLVHLNLELAGDGRTDRQVHLVKTRGCGTGQAMLPYRIEAGRGMVF